MIKKIKYLIFKFLKIIYFLIKFLINRSFMIWIREFFHDTSYKVLKINKRKINFFTPNLLTEYRVDTFFSKEPETLKWIDSFENKKGGIFWDIGSNIGLFSIYNSLKNKNLTTISFEPSTSNLRVLSRNIFINNFQKKIKIFPIPLSNKNNRFLTMSEGNFMEGGALNSFGEKFNFEGKKFEGRMEYITLGTSINYLIKHKILEIPDYIKIDVDGNEHLILEGANKFLKNKKIKSLSIEINENFSDQYQIVLKIMKKNNFKILSKNHAQKNLDKKSKFFKSYNYIFIR